VAHRLEAYATLGWVIFVMIVCCGCDDSKPSNGSPQLEATRPVIRQVTIHVPDMGKRLGLL
jgi:hypothetical protein